MLSCLQTKQKYHITAFARKTKESCFKRNKQNYCVTLVNESVSITFDVLALLEIKCRK